MSVEDRTWMYEGWNDNGCHSEVWLRNTNAFLDRAFTVVPNAEKYGVVCPCSECCNRVRRRRAAMSMHLCKRGFMPGYTRWTEHGEHIVSSSTLEDVCTTTDGLDEMLGEFGDAMQMDSVEEEPTADAKAFYAIYEVNGYRFRSEKYEKSRGNLTTNNTRVLAVGFDDSNDKGLEYYGIIKDIIELQFDGDSEFSLVLFDWHWFHPINVVRHLERFGVVEVAHASCNPANEPFVLASQVKQVYYLPYACKNDPSLNEWWIAHNVCPLGNLSIPSMDGYQAEDPPSVDVFQEDGLEGEFYVDIGVGLDDIASTNNVDKVVDLREVSMLIKQRNGVIEENEPTVGEEERGSDSENEEQYQDDPDDF